MQLHQGQPGQRREPGQRPEICRRLGEKHRKAAANGQRPNAQPGCGLGPLVAGNRVAHAAASNSATTLPTVTN